MAAERRRRPALPPLPRGRALKPVPGGTGRPAPAPSARPLILLVNDDGFFSHGLRSLQRAVRGLGTVVVVAPDREMSATSLSLTLHRPLRARQVARRVYAVDGTPADCVYLAVRKILPRRPDLLLSGINHGPNVAQQDIAYSGTVAGAVQGTFLGIPSAAFSLFPGAHGRFDFVGAAGWARAIAAMMLDPDGRPVPGVTLNVNIPPPPVAGVRLTRLGWKAYTPEVVEKTDPRERAYFWIGTGTPQETGGRDTDISAIEEGFVSITPIHRDLTDRKSLRSPAFRDRVEALKPR